MGIVKTDRFAHTVEQASNGVVDWESLDSATDEPDGQMALCDASGSQPKELVASFPQITLPVGHTLRWVEALLHLDLAGSYGSLIARLRNAAGEPVGYSAYVVLRNPDQQAYSVSFGGPESGITPEVLEAGVKMVITMHAGPPLWRFDGVRLSAASSL